MVPGGTARKPKLATLAGSPGLTSILPMATVSPLRSLTMNSIRCGSFLRICVRMKPPVMPRKRISSSSERSGS
ncbi:MAG: hypothetical protein DMG42_08740 [Acidobacteria bacterium]|nr:MAG: hypothetical protein DMG42_08740 [Acidobacteriota bacterium]